LQTVAGRQQQDRRVDAMLSDAGENLQAIATGQHDIEENDIELFCVDPEECVFAGMRDHGLVAFIFETFL
jgi:hypothetical protein